MGKKTQTDKGLQKAQWMSNPLGKRLYTLKEAAQYMGRTVWGMRELVWAGEIPVVKGSHARKIYLDISDLENYINQNKSVYR